MILSLDKDGTHLRPTEGVRVRPPSLVRLLVRVLLALVWALALLLVPHVAVQLVQAEAAPPPTQATALVSMLNAVRALQTPPCAPLHVVAALQTAAQAHSHAMATEGFLGPRTPSGGNPAADATAAGYRGMVTVQVAAGPATAGELVGAWLPDPTMRAQLLDCQMTAIGVGFADDVSGRTEVRGIQPGGVVLVEGTLTHYWTVLLGTGGVQ